MMSSPRVAILSQENSVQETDGFLRCYPDYCWPYYLGVRLPSPVIWPESGINSPICRPHRARFVPAESIIALHPAGVLQINLYLSWNGATKIASYRLYGDTNPVPTTLLGELPRDGFETTLIYEAPDPGVYYFRVMPVDKEGRDTQYSPISVTVAIENPIMFPIVADGN
jgi:hypothetical protein